MKERPIIFSGEMVRAILDGRKTQTRRVIKPQPEWEDPRECEDAKWADYDDWHSWEYASFEHIALKNFRRCPYGQPGDRLWVRETWAMSGYKRVEYRAFPADGSDFRSVSGWKPSIHMPRWASRINLLVKDIRVERVQDIRASDAYEEGVQCDCMKPDACKNSGMLVPKFTKLWNSINEKRGFGWDKNPWVWVVEFEME